VLARVEYLVLNAIIADQHYCAGDTDGKDRSHERIPQRQSAEPRRFSPTQLWLEEQLPRQVPTIAR